MDSYQKYLQSIELLKKSNKISDLKKFIKEYNQEVTFTHKVHKIGFKMAIDTRFNGFQSITITDANYQSYSLDLLLTII